MAGLLAAAIVVFVPIGMAGWHLTRNRLLFFGAAFFITLAILVHVMPYIPSVLAVLSLHPRSIATGLDPQSTFLKSNGCFSHLHSINWEKLHLSPNVMENRSQLSAARWSWIPRKGCNFQIISRSDSLQLLKGARIIVAGDSQARFFFVSFLELLTGNVEEIKLKLFKYHSNYDYTIHKQQIKVDYVWASYTSDITRLLLELHTNKTYPDIIIMGAGLWHMLHVANASSYGYSLQRLRRTVFSLSRVASFSEHVILGGTEVIENSAIPRFFWLNMPTLIPSLLNSELKRQRMTTNATALYAKELLKSALTYPKGPCFMIDLEILSQGCGPNCTLDVQILMNFLLMSS
ncbi:hypothetical protein O6H91_11G023100 [Diphasiastrum complanatum]|uniref:Uncharacterized protein n=1 Tax=Diphasiastrum complanatum TaxID=34168 RepID=A0ACC2C743_DIPCM|nr:hypothetical protein O6H91_11G023100 [Diphasiastrum complanatum]